MGLVPPFGCALKPLKSISSLPDEAGTLVAFLAGMVSRPSPHLYLLTSLAVAPLLACGETNQTPSGDPEVEVVTRDGGVVIDAGESSPPYDGGTTTQDPDAATVANDAGREAGSPDATTAGAPDASIGTGNVDGVWISRDEIMMRPTSGAAWDALLDEANQSAGTPNLSDQNNSTNVAIMAKALVYARIGGNNYLNDVLAALSSVTQNQSESGGRTLALGRELIAYVIAADVIDLESVDPALDADFRTRLRELLTKNLSGRTLQSTHEDRPNNWGTHAGASRAAVAVYLEDQQEIDRTADVFHGWVGDRTAYSAFSYGSLSWQCDSGSPVGINPVGCVRDGHRFDGIAPDDQRRCGDYSWPPCKTNYAWEGLQGALAQAVILGRRGYPVWDWEDRALLRAVEWLHETTFDDGNNYEADGDDSWQPWLVNYFYCESFPASSPSQPGKNVGWTDWTHAENPTCP